VKKKLFAAVLVLALTTTTIAILLFLRLRLPTTIQKNILIPYFEKQFPCLKINFSSISTNLINSMYINDFAIYLPTDSATPMLFAKTATFHFNIFKGIKLNAIYKISFKDCRLQFDIAKYKEILSLYRNFSNRKKISKFPLVDIYFCNLHLSLFNSVKNRVYDDYEITAIKLRTRNRKTGLTLAGRYFSDKKQSFFVNVEIEDIFKIDRLKILCKNFPLSLFDVVSDKIKYEGGVFIETTICKKENVYSCDGEVSLNSAKISIMDGGEFKTFTIGKSEILYSSYRDTLVVKQCKVEICGSEIFLSGEMNPLNKGNIAANLKIKSANLNIAKFAHIFPQLDRFFSSSTSVVDAEVKFEGNFSTYTLLVNLGGKVCTKFGELENLQVSIEHDRNGTTVNSLVGKISRGEVKATGVVKGESCNFLIKMCKIDLAEPLRIERVVGRMPAELNINLSIEKGKLSIFSNYLISIYQSPYTAIKGELQLQTNSKFYVKGQLLPYGYNFLYEGVEKDGVLFIQKGEFAFSQKEKIFTAGKFTLFGVKGDNVSLSISSDLISLDRFYTKLAGETYLSGTVCGNISYPRVYVSFRGREKSLGEYTCVLYSSTEASKGLQVSFQSVRGGIKQLLSWERLTMQASYTDGLLYVSKILLKQQSGGELLFYLIPVEKRNFSNCIIKADNLKFYDKEISFLFDGKYTRLQDMVKLLLFSPYLSIGGTRLGDLSATISFSESDVCMELLGLNNRLNSNFVVKKNGNIVGKLSLSNLEFDRISRIFLPSIADRVEKDGSKICANITMSGKLLLPDFSGNVVLKNFTLQNRKYNIENFISGLLSKRLISGKTAILPVKKSINKREDTLNLSWNFLISSFTAKPHELLLSFEKDLTYKDLMIYTPQVKFIFGKDKINVYSEIDTNNGTLVIEKESFVKFPSDIAGSLEFLLQAEIRSIGIVNTTIWGDVSCRGKYSFYNNDTEITLESPTFWVNQYNFSNFKARIVKKGRTLNFYPDRNAKYTIESNIEFLEKDNLKFTHFNMREDDNNIFSISGKYSGRDLDISIEGNKFPLDVLFGILNFKTRIEGYSNFQLLITGNISNPKIVGQINSLEGKIYNLPYTKLSAWFSVKDKMLNISYSKVYLKDKYSLDLSGVFPLEKRGYYNVKCSVPSCDLSVLSYLFSWVKHSKGAVSGNLYLSGPSENPSLEGEIKIHKGEFFMTDLLKNISSVNGEIVLKNNRFIVKNFGGYVGKGNFTLSGSGVIDRGGVEYSFTLQTKGETGLNISWNYLSIPQSSLFGRILSQPSYGEAKVDVEVKGSKEVIYITGMVELNNAHFTYPPRQEIKLSTAEGYPKLYLDLTIVANKNVWYENELIRANIEGEIKLKGPSNNLEINGDIRSYRGVLSYLGKIFNLKYAELEIKKNVPYLECRAETNVSLPLSSDASVRSSPTHLILEINREKLVHVKPRLYSTDREFAKYSTEDFLKQIGKYQEPITVEKIELILREEIIKLFDSALVSPLARFMLQETRLVDNIVVTQEETVSKKEEILSSPISIVDILAGTKYTFQKSITGQTFFEYILKLDRSALFQNRLDIRQEIAFSHRWKNFLLRASIGVPENITQPLDSERKISVEVHDRFGW